MRILITTYSTHPEPQQMAAALTEAGHSVRIATAASFGADSATMGLASRLERSRGWAALSAEIRRRQLPAGLVDAQVMRGGHASELANLLHRKLRGDLERAGAAMKRRDAALGRRVGRHLRGLAEPYDMVIAQQGSAFPAFREVDPARTVRVLNYPIAHHRWLAREMQRELTRRPEHRTAIYLSDIPDESTLAVLDAEVDAADHLIVGSSFVKETCIEFGVPEERISVLPLASVKPELDASAKSPGAQRDAAVQLVFAGQVTQRKGIYDLLAALDGLPSGAAHLTVIGEGPRSVMNDLRSRQDVTVLGSMPRPVLMSRLKDADVSVLPSLGEGFPLTQIEAMAVGTPVVVSTSTFGHDVVDEGVDGFVVAPRDVAGLGAAIRRFIEDPDLSGRMGAAAQVKATEFTWPKYRERVVPLVEGIAQSRRV